LKKSTYSPPTPARKEEGRLIFEQFFGFFGQLATEILYALLISIAITAAFIIAQWNVSDTFVTNLVTVNSILIAAVGLLANFIVQGTRFNEFVKHTEEAYWDATEKGSPNRERLAQIHGWNMTLFIVLPAIAAFPFFISVILALGALVTSDLVRLVLTTSAFFLMLWSFLSILFCFWKFAILMRQYIKSPNPER
jgi:hypothetical protein